MPKKPAKGYREWFEDLRCDDGELAPKHLQAHLTALGGTTIHGKPAFRVARAETIGRKIAIDFPIWREGDDPNHVIPIREAVEMMNIGLAQISQDEIINSPELAKQRKDRLGREVHEFVTQTAERNERPLRRDEGYRWVQKYCFKGIVIEKWNPPDMYGNPAEWEAKKILGFSFCGPFPHEGDYELIGGDQEEDEESVILNNFGKPFTAPRAEKIPWPTKDKLLILMQDYHDNLHTQPENPFTRTMLRVAEFEQRELARKLRLEKHFEPLVKEIDAIFRSVSLEAQRIREEMVRNCKMLNYGKGIGHIEARSSRVNTDGLSPEIKQAIAALGHTSL